MQTSSGDLDSRYARARERPRCRVDGPSRQAPEPAEPWYRDNVKNVTVSLPDDVYRRARIKAAERDTSLSGLVRSLLIEAAAEESEFERRKRLQHEVLGSIERFQASDRLTRDDAHDRDALR